MSARRERLPLLLAALLSAMLSLSRETAASGVQITANDHGVRLRTKAGKVLTYENTHACRSEDERELTLCDAYSAVHDRARNLIVLSVTHWEGQEYILVDDRTGDETLIEGEFTHSPTGEHVVEITAGADGYDATGPAVRIWSRRGGEFVVEWQGAPFFRGDETSYRVISWETPKEIELAVTARLWSHVGEPLQNEERFFALRRSPSGWQIIAGR